MNTVWTAEIENRNVVVTMGDDDSRNVQVQCEGRTAIYHLFEDLHVACVYGKPLVEIEGDLLRAVIEMVWLQVRAMREGPPC